MRLFKKLTAGATAIVMAVGMMSMTASAEKWSVVFNNVTPPTTTSKHSFYASKDIISYFYENCTSYNQTNNAGNQPAYVQYIAGNYMANGTLVNDCTKYYYHKSKQEIHKVDLSSSVPVGHYLRVTYTLILNGLSCSMGGDVYA